MSIPQLLVIADPNSRYVSLLNELEGRAHVTVTYDRDQAIALAPRADIVLAGVGAPASIVQPVIEAASQLQWLHSLSAGVDTVMSTSIGSNNIPVTNAKGAYSGSLGEYCVAAMLFFAKSMRRLLASQKANHWDVFNVEMLEGKTLGILGYGDIGKASAKRAKAFGVKIIALRRRPDKSAGDDIADEIWGMDRKLDLMAASDYVLLAMPNTPDTKGIVGEAELRAMKPTGVIINLGRGNAIDEPALIKALSENWIRGAALDVFETEPLPAGHPLYAEEKLLMSAHTADHTDTWMEDSTRIFLENFRLWEAGQPLKNYVDKSVGY